MNDALLRVGVDAAKATLEAGFSDGAATLGRWPTTRPGTATSAFVDVAGFAAT